MIDAPGKKAVVEAYTSSHSKGDVDGIMALFADDALAWDPVGAEPHSGSEGIRAFFTATHEMVDSLTLEITGPVRCAAEFAAFPMTATTVMGDTRLEIDVIDVFTFDDEGRITEMKAYWNMADARLNP